VLTFTFTNTSAGNWNYSIGIPAADVSGSATLASGSLIFNGNGTLTNVTPTAGGTVTGTAGNLTGIAINGLTDGASNMTSTGTFSTEPFP